MNSSAASCDVPLSYITKTLVLIGVIDLQDYSRIAGSHDDAESIVGKPLNLCTASVKPPVLGLPPQSRLPNERK